MTNDSENDKKKEIKNSVIKINQINSMDNNRGMTQEYDRSLYDSSYNKQKYKDKIFGNNQTVKDPISGNILHKNQSSAQKKYHIKNSSGTNISSAWAKHSAETDHINSLKNTHNIAKYNPYLTDEDFKEIMNSDANYRILSKSLNTSKGDKSDFKIIFDKNNGMSAESRTKMAKEKIKSDIVMSGKFTAKTAKNIAKTELAIPLATEAVYQMIKLADGETSLKDAAKDTVKNTLKDGAKAVAYNVTQTVIKRNIMPIIAVADIVKNTVVKYISGEIDEEELISNVKMQGTMIVAGMIGNEVGNIVGTVLGATVLPGIGFFVGKVIGTVVITAACGAIISFYNVKKHLNDYKLKEEQVRQLETTALKEMENQRKNFKEIIKEEYDAWDKNIQSGFDQIFSCACEDNYNLQGITDGLDKILSVFGKEVKFKNLKEYEEQLDMPLELSF